MRQYRLLTAAGFSLLAACGGGGGGGVSVDSPDPSLSTNSNNAMQVAKVSYESALTSGGLGAMSGNGVFVSSAPGGVAKVQKGLAVAQKSGSAQSGVPIPPETTPCASSGTVTLSGDIADPFTPTLSPGDFFEIDYNACDEGSGDVIDGLMRLDINSFSGDFLNELLAARAPDLCGGVASPSELPPVVSGRRPSE